MDDYKLVCARFALDENAHAVRADWLFSRALLSQAVAFAFAAMGAARILGAAVRSRDRFSFPFPVNSCSSSHRCDLAASTLEKKVLTALVNFLPLVHGCVRLSRPVESPNAGLHVGTLLLR